MLSILLLLLITSIHSLQIPYIDNAVFIPISVANTTSINNQTCIQCLCRPNSSSLALNCFPNNTCQFFNTFPLRYTVQSQPQGRFYLLQQIFPNASQCCMPNTTDLLNKLNNATRISANVSGSRCLTLDNHGYLVTVSDVNSNIVRFYPTNLSLVTQPVSPTFTATPWTITYYNEAYYIGFTVNILVVDSNNLTILYNITVPYLLGPRDTIFLNNGQTMVFASSNNNSLVFLNRVSNTSKNYNFSYKRSVSYANPHGLRYVNDTFFYATSWSADTFYSYSFMNSSGNWTEKLAINATPLAPSGSGNHLAIDACNRFWLSMETSAVRLFDSQGKTLGNLTHLIPYAFDTMLTDNYVIYISGTQSNQIIRLDPHIQC